VCGSWRCLRGFDCLPCNDEEFERALEIQALVLMEGMTSMRTRKAITSIRFTLAVYQRRRVPGAADLARRAREALA
jgi:hypothetical protein